MAAISEVPATKVVVLGIAQDGGVPQIGCTQEICRTQKHGVSSLAIVHNGATYLIDASPDIREQYAELMRRKGDDGNATPGLVDGIFLTHAHMGHYAGLLFLGKESISTKRTPVYCSADMATYLKSNAPWRLLVENGNIAIHTIEDGKPLDMGFKITPLAVPHRKEFTDTYGFLIQGNTRTLLYIPDIDAWEPIEDKIQNWLTHSDYALVDGTFFSGKELPGRDMSLVPHPTIEHSVQFFQKFNDIPTAIYFTHLNHTNPVLLPESGEFHRLKEVGYHVAVDWQEFHL